MSKTLNDIVRRCYLEENLNCAETLLKACNEYYQLDIPEDCYPLLSAFGGGMQTGNVCGALSGCTAALGKMLVETKAHECEDLRRCQVLLMRTFRQLLNETQCAKLKAMHFDMENRCLKTCFCAAQAMETTVAAIEQNRNS